MAYTKREKQILSSINKIEIKYMIRCVDEYTPKTYRELAANIKKKGIKSLTDIETRKLKKIGGMTTITHYLTKALMGYI
jgi:hypothetical protein